MKSVKHTKNKNGQGSISYEPDRNKYRASITIGGERYRARFASKQEAEEWLTLKKAEVIQGTFVPPSEYTIGQWSVEYLKTYALGNVEESTYNSYLTIANNFKPIENIKLKDLKAHTIQKFYNSFENIGALSNVHKLLHVMLHKAAQLRIIAINPMDAVIPPRKQTKEVITFTVDEIKALLKFLKNSDYYSKYYLLVLLAISTGLRASEIFGLKYKAIRNGYLHIDCAVKIINSRITEGLPKENKIRDVTIDASLEKALRGNHKGRLLPNPNDYVFPSRANVPIRAQSFWRTWKQILKYANIPYKKFHSLRHTHATQLLANGIPIHEVSKRLGHANASITLDIYGHAIKGYDEKIPAKVAQIFSV